MVRTENLCSYGENIEVEYFKDLFKIFAGYREMFGEVGNN
jgi:hypothetical protein